LRTLIDRIAVALKTIDAVGGAHKSFLPGIGPFGEPQLVRLVAQELAVSYPDEYGGARTMRQPDLMLPGRWALEFKIVRPFGDNGRPAEHWSENLLHPYLGNVSALGDCLKLAALDVPERRCVVVVTYSHHPPRIEFEPLIRSFEVIADQVLGLSLGPRYSSEALDLIHPVHARATVFGWEVFSPSVAPH
jgi:hypothetical protein